MNEFLYIEFVSDESRDDLYDLLVLNFPDYRWMCGDSDIQGLYITGANEESVQIQLWLEEPEVMTVSFSLAWVGEPDRDRKKELLFKKIQDVLFPVFKKVESIKEHE